MDVLFERVAGLDVGTASVTVCVRTPGGEWLPTWRDAHVLDDDAVAGGDGRLGRSSKWCRWRRWSRLLLAGSPVFYFLEERIECWLLNAAHNMKAVPAFGGDPRTIGRVFSAAWGVWAHRG